MIYLLDSNTCIIYLKYPLSKVRQRLESLSEKDIAVCSIVKAELFYGARKSNNPKKSLAVQQLFFNRFVCLDFDSQSAEIYGIIRSQLETEGTPIGPYDLQIAAVALANNLTLVTHNVREFTRVDGLRIEDWEA
jgi:tRNA(fMet)-specific endonuclease VapC